MRLNVPPTKSTSLSLRRDLGFALEGRELLEQKREILVMELMQHVEAARREQEEVDRLLAGAHGAFQEAAVGVGSERLAREGLAVPVRKGLSVGEHRVMGISVPVVGSEPEPVAASFGFAGGTAKTDQVMVGFSRALEAIGRLAQTQTAVFRLARELRKTQRRVNALDKIFIPDYVDTLGYIRSTLEEREREWFVVMRIVREKLRSVAAEAGAGKEG